MTFFEGRFVPGTTTASLSNAIDGGNPTSSRLSSTGGVKRERLAMVSTPSDTKNDLVLWVGHRDNVAVRTW